MQIAYLDFPDFGRLIKKEEVNMFIPRAGA